ncbi:hypothetical protein scyTo_0006617 [Scyliorhinus torazame]|uniref:B30.2/SPRY domain-containing protein n=1 Tax=Scyliorhinus torazame TaxID=75743 RepID=A0A401PJ20_SCYTO|nr:hypothetical protein [Scyliorhinus torazame]
MLLTSIVYFHPVVVSPTVLPSMDQDTSDSRFTVSKDGISVIWDSKRRRTVEHKLEHQESWTIWGSDGISDGKHYWQVLVTPGSVWSVGVSKRRVAMNRWHRPTPENGYWTLMLWNMKGDKQNVRSFGDSVLLTQQSKLGVYLDYEGGRVSFYNPDKGNHLYTFNTKFIGNLYPAYKLWISIGGNGSIAIE